MNLTAKTKLNDLVRDYPFLSDFLAGFSPRYEKLKNPILGRTLGRVATLSQVAGFGDIPLEKLLTALAGEIKRVTKETVPVETSGPAAESLDSREARLEVLKDIIRDLHQGEAMATLKQRFAALIQDVTPTEIAEMEQRLIEEGMPESEVKRLCDVHVQVFKESLAGQSSADSTPGHPVHTLMKENRALEAIAAEMRGLLDKLGTPPSSRVLLSLKPALEAGLLRLAEVDKHYLKKENQFFPLLEAKGVSGPSKVMWAIHDDIRDHLKQARTLLHGSDPAALADLLRQVLTELLDMVYKEEKILFPMSLETLAEPDWVRVKQGEEEIGYAWITPGREWKEKHKEDRQMSSTADTGQGKISLSTGALTPEQVNMMLKHLPVDISFVDENDTVAYYSATPERIFTRVPAVIGRKVQNCHPPDSVHVVNHILDAFRKGEKSSADFWIQLGGKFILIRYFALRDEKGTYRGCLEVSQNVTSIRALEGQQRLLDWK